jgi:RNA polymerase sigma-70 factor (ECF subfamily)
VPEVSLVSDAHELQPMNDLPVVPAPAMSGSALDLDALFREHYARLVRALTVAGGDREAAAEAVQDAFVKAHLHERKLRRYDDPVGWIRRVAINRLRDQHRTGLRRRRLDHRLAAEPTAVQPAADAMWDARMVGDELPALLAGLPRQQRLAVSLFYVDGLTVREIATALGISEGAVKFHLHEGRSKLRSVLDPNGGSL